MPEVHVVIVTYGDRLHLLQCVLSKLFDDRNVAAIHIVSNSAHYPLPDHRKIRPLLLSENTGSANGYKLGIQQALEQNPGFIWLLDDDNQPATGTLEHLVNQYEALRQTQTDMTCLAVTSLRSGRKVVAATDKPSSSFLGFQISDLGRKIWQRLVSKPEVVKDPSQPLEINTCPYGGLLFEPHLVDIIGLPETDFVLYADDLEFTSRIRRQQGKLYLISEAVLTDVEESWIVGKGSTSSLEMWLTTPGDMRAFYSARNLVYLERSLADNKGLFHLNRLVYTTVLAVYAIGLRQQDRFRLLSSAFKDAQAGRLGIDNRFPLP